MSFPEEEGKDYGKEDFDLEIADSAEIMKPKRMRTLLKFLRKQKEYLKEKNAVIKNVIKVTCQ